MNATLQFTLTSADLATVLALVRTGTLGGAAERLGVDTSTVFRGLQRVERGLGVHLFERSRAGYAAGELARTLAERAEQIEAALEEARTAAQQQPARLSGLVRITTTDTLLHGLVAPAIAGLRGPHPALSYELHAGNELASLTRRDSDIAVRATRRPPQHLVGKHIGPLRLALFAARTGAGRGDVDPGKAAWIAPDDALPEHPSVVWRKRHFPKAVPAYRVHSILTVMELVALGLGIGVLPLFLAQGRTELRQLGEVLAECQTELWLLTHPESRHIRRIATVYAHLADALVLE